MAAAARRLLHLGFKCLIRDSTHIHVQLFFGVLFGTAEYARIHTRCFKTLKWIWKIQCKERAWREFYNIQKIMCACAFCGFIYKKKVCLHKSRRRDKREKLINRVYVGGIRTARPHVQTVVHICFTLTITHTHIASPKKQVLTILPLRLLFPHIFIFDMYIIFMWTLCKNFGFIVCGVRFTEKKPHIGNYIPHSYVYNTHICHIYIFPWRALSFRSRTHQRVRILCLYNLKSVVFRCVVDFLCVFFSLLCVFYSRVHMIYEE